MSIVLVQSVLDEKTYTMSLFSILLVSFYLVPSKYDNLFHFLSTTNPSDQYKTQKIVFLNYNYNKTNIIYTFDMKRMLYRGEQIETITKTLRTKPNTQGIQL